MEEQNNECASQACDEPQKTKTQIFNADFLFIAIAAVAVHSYAMVYTYLFVM